jgi:hypothetical protein
VGRRAVAASLLAGIVLMVFFDRPLTRVLGLACLAAFVVGGVFVIANPQFLVRDKPPPR